MSQSPQKLTGSKRYTDGWRAVNELIRADGSWSGRERNNCYWNEGDGGFQDVSYVSGLDFDGDARSFVSLDYDHDGDLDLIVKFRTEPQLRILRNDVAQGRPSLRIAFDGEAEAVGARAVLETDRRKLLRHVVSGAGYLAQTSRRLHFGLEDGERQVSLTVEWPGEETSRFDSLPPSGLVRVSKNGLVPWQPAPPHKIPGPPAMEPLVISGTWLVEPVPAPDFEAETLGGGRTRLSAMRGRRVLLNFWATWCPPCQAEMEDFQQNLEALRAADVEVLAVSVDDPADRAKVESFVGDRQLTFPILLANDRVVGIYSIVNRYLFDRRRDLGIPTSFLIDSEGRIVKVYVGATRAALIAGDARAMKGNPLPFPGRRYFPPPSRNYLDLGTAMAERGYRPEAMAVFRAALDAGQEGHELYTNLAGLLLEEGRVEEAEKYLQISLAQRPNQIDAKVNLATVLVRRGDWQQAAQLLEQLTAIYPDDPYLLDLRGTVEFRRERLQEAQRLFRRAVEFDPETWSYRYNLGAALAAGGRLEEARTEFREAVAQGGQSFDLLNNLGSVEAQLGDLERALAAFREASEIDPAHLGARMNQAQALAALGRAQEARAVLDGILRDQPDFTPAREMLNRLP